MRHSMSGLMVILMACKTEKDPNADNMAPIGEITSHQDGDTMEVGTVRFFGTVSDRDHTQTELLVSWALNGEDVCEGLTPDQEGITSCDIALDEGLHSISMQVVDPEGASDNADVQVEAYLNGVPEVIITAPAPSSSYYSNQEVIFSATVSDLEDEPQDLVVEWVSSVDGSLSVDDQPSSEGEIFGSTFLSQGTHQVEISVTDSDGNSSSDAVVLEILPPNTVPSCNLYTPLANSTFLEGETIAFEGSVADVEIAASDLLIEFSSDKDGVFGNPTADSSGVVQFSSNQLSPDLHSITMRVTDDGQLSCTDSVSLSIEGLPHLTINSPLQADVYNEGATVAFSASVTDADTSPSDISVRWESSVNGLLREANADPSGTSVFQTAALLVGSHTISATATDSDGNTTSELVDIRINDLPSAPTLTYAPTPIYTSDDIVISPSGSTDLEGDPISYVYTWYRNGNVDLAYTTDTLPSAATTRGDSWRVDVAASDGYGEGGVSSLTVVVENSPPQIAAAVLSPTTAYETTSLHCQASLPQDADNDSLTYQYVWRVNGSVVPVSGDMLDGSSFSKGDTVQCQLTPFDGIELGNTANSSTLTVQNSAPSVSAAIVNPQTPSAADSLLCAYTNYVDPDGDASQSVFEWTVNGIPVSSTPSLSGGFGYGDVVVCTITPSDGEDDGTPVSTSVLIENTQPVLADVSITPSEPIEGDTLYCTPGITSDIDGTTSFTYTYSWEVNGLPHSNVSSTLTAAEYQRDDIIRCFATPNDGVEDGTPVASPPVVVGNSLPSIGTVSIAPTSPYASTVLTCSYTSFFDADGDSDQSIIDWTINGVYANSGPQLTTGYVYDDVVACTVTPSDGTDSGVSKSASVTIQNSPPSIAQASVTPANPRTGDTLVCSYSGFVDVDGHPDNSTFSWYVNGNLAGISDILNGGFVGGDSVSCTVTPNDGITTGAAYTVTVPIANTPPVLSGATLSPTVPYEGDTITCTPGSTTDADGTLIFNYSYTWIINGVDIGHSTNSLSSSQFQHGDVVGCLVTPNDGIDDGDLVSAGTVTVANAIPSIASIAINPASPHADDALTCSYPNFFDADNDPDLSVIQWEINGVVVGQGANLTGGFEGGDTVSCTVTPYDGIDYGTPLEQNVVINNTAPSVDTVSILPTPPRAGQTLTCEYTGFLDIDNNPDLSTIQWQLNGINAGSGATFAGNFTEGDVVGCVVTPYDGIAQGTPVGVTETVANSAPVLSQVLLSPSVVFEGDTLQCLPGATSDADGTTVFTYQYAWEVNGVASSEIDSTLSSDFFNHNDNVRCMATPCDATDCGDPVASVTLVVENTEPVVSTVLISPNPAYAGDVLDCVYTYEDVDGDPDQSSIEWTVNGQYAHTGQAFAGDFVFGDVIECVVTPDDGYDEGLAESGTLIVSNTLPELASVDLSPTVVREGDTLTCTPSGASDVDETPVNLSYEWIVDGINIGIGTSTLTSQYFDRDQVVECIVTPDDGTDDGAPVYSNSIFVANTPPSVTGIFLNPATATADTTLTCGYTGFADIDGDSDQSIIRWEVNGVSAATGVGSLSGVFVGGDLVTCMVTPNDGTDNGQTQVASLIVENTPPEIDSLVLSKVATQQGTVLDCAVDAVTDPDGTVGLTYTYSWMVNNQPVSVTSDSLYPGYYSRGDEVWCYAIPFDGTENGPQAESNHLIIDNVAPTIASVSITPTSPTVADVLTCSYTGFFDADADVDQSQISWEVNGVYQGSGATLSSGYNRYDSVTCRVVPYDGVDVGPAVTASTLIENDVPSIASVSITPNPADQSDVLTCSYASFVDADNDSDQTLYSWTNNGAEVSTASTLSGVFTRGDEVTCTATPFDGTDLGVPVSDTITISNGLPSVDSVTLTETELFTDSSITVVATGSDPDGDPVTLNYQWLVDGQAVAETSDTLSGVLFFSKHDTVQAVVTANDGFDDGNPSYSTIITVQNAPPTNLLVSIDPVEADVDRDDLRCEILSHATDADGDPITYSFAWEISNSLSYNGPYMGAPYTSVYNGDTISVAETEVGENWLCSVVPSDGEEDGAVAEADVNVVYNYFDVEVVPGDTFTMGSSSAEVGRIAAREDSHSVTLSRDMRVMRFEVTQAEFEDLMGYNPSIFSGCPDCPVENISWHEAAALANEASITEGFSMCYTCTGSGSSVVCSVPTDIYSCSGYRLPTDAEWEYLARAGSASAYSNGGSLVDGTQTSCSSSIILSNGENLGNIGYFCGNSLGASQPVGGLDANDFNLYDMHGNIQEWTNDWYVGSLGGTSTTDPNGPASGTAKVLRGGAWSLQPSTLRSANRAYMTPATRQSYVGVRLLRTQ